MANTAMSDEAPAGSVRPLAPAEFPARIADLAALLMDAVAGGSSVNFLSGLTADEAAAFWHRQSAAVDESRIVAFVAEDGARIVGCVLLMHATQPNAPYRAEIGKMIVHSAYRRRGLGRALLRRAEDAARGRPQLAGARYRGGQRRRPPLPQRGLDRGGDDPRLCIHARPAACRRNVLLQAAGVALSAGACRRPSPCRPDAFRRNASARLQAVWRMCHSSG